MEEESFPAAERIISDIESAFKKDPKLKEFDIVRVTLNENKSPVLLQCHSLGLESWCVRHVYCHAHNRLMDIRQQRMRREADPEHVARLLTTALLLNPDVSTFWNMRRELFVASRLDPHSELHFSAVVLSRKPKSVEVFSYRKWLIKNLMKDFLDDPGLPSNEFHVCDQAAERHPNNYHAWNHRIWCLNHLLATSDGDVDCQKMLNILTDEWTRSYDWITTHVSDHSGFQYRQHLLKKLLAVGSKNISHLRRTVPNLFVNLEKAMQSFFHQTSTAAPKGGSCLNFGASPMRDVGVNPGVDDDGLGVQQPASGNLESAPETALVLGLLCSEILLNIDLIIMFHGHEALWYHRRYVLFAFQANLLKNAQCSKTLEAEINRWDCCGRNTVRSYQNLDGVPPEKESKMDEFVVGTLKARLIHFEKLLCNRCRDDYQQSKAASRHKVWLENVLKIELL